MDKETMIYVLRGMQAFAFVTMIVPTVAAVYFFVVDDYKWAFASALLFLGARYFWNSFDWKNFVREMRK